MNHCFALLAALLAIAPAWAASLSVWPRNATTQDSLVLVVQAAPPCATIALDGAQLLEGGVIRVPFDDGSRVLCTMPNPCPLVVPLGRLPAGTYWVEFVPDRPSLTSASATEVTVYQSVWPGEGHNYLPRRLSQDCAG